MTHAGAAGSTPERTVDQDPTADRHAAGTGPVRAVGPGHGEIHGECVVVEVEVVGERPAAPGTGRSGRTVLARVSLADLELWFG